MPNSETNIKKKPFYKKIWGVISVIVAISGATWGILEAVYVFTEKWHEYEHLKEDHYELKRSFLNLVNQDLEKDEKIKSLEDYIQGKRSSGYAVGFRVVYEENEDSGEIKAVKKYRDWLGNWHRVYLDREWTELYGVDYYFYYDEKTGEKVFCW